MKPLSFAGRPARWLMAAGLALAAMQGLPASGPAAPNCPKASTSIPAPSRIPARRGRAVLHQDRRAARTATTSSTTLRFGARGDPAKFLDPAFIARPEERADGFPRHAAGRSRDRRRAGLRRRHRRRRRRRCPRRRSRRRPTPTTRSRSTTSVCRPAISTARARSTRPLHRLRHHGQDRPCGVSSPDARRQPGLRRASASSADRRSMVPSHDPSAAGRRRFHDRRADQDPDRRHHAATVRLRRLRARKRASRSRPATVDCVPGGGAFIYHMPVGPELGGKWVQLRTTTPGVIVAPALAARPDRRRRAQLDHQRRPARRCRASHRHRRRDLCRTGRGRRPLLHADRRHRHPGGPRMSARRRTRHQGREACRRGALHAGRRLRLHHPGHQCRRRALQWPDRARRGDGSRQRGRRFGAERALGLRADGEPDELHASGDHARSRRMGRAEARLRARTRLGLDASSATAPSTTTRRAASRCRSARPPTTRPAPRSRSAVAATPAAIRRSRRRPTCASPRTRVPCPAPPMASAGSTSACSTMAAKTMSVR